MLIVTVPFGFMGIVLKRRDEMIQDILPLHLQNQYEKRQPDDTSYMMIYRENKILVKEGETLSYLPGISRDL